MHFTVFYLWFDAAEGCVFSEMCVRSHFCTKSSVYEYVTRAPVCFGLLVGTSNNSLAFSPRAPNRKRAGRSHLSSGSFHHRNWARWKCWSVEQRQDAGGRPGFLRVSSSNIRGNIWLEEIVLNVLGLMIHDGKCDHRNWGYYGKEHVQSSCAYHRFYCILVPLPTILG